MAIRKPTWKAYLEWLLESLLGMAIRKPTWKAYLEWLLESLLGKPTWNGY
jgi:preprotein translocase subunit Sss1